jgi:hypothetical protein
LELVGRQIIEPLHYQEPSGLADSDTSAEQGLKLFADQ